MNDSQRAQLLRELFQAGVDAVGGRQACYQALARHTFTAPVHLVALGKAADAMATGAIAALGSHLRSGLVITKHDHLSDTLRTDDRLECLESGHPVPDEASLAAGKRLIEFVSGLASSDVLVFLVSGGTSALVEHLVDGLSLDDLTRETDQLLASGAAIGDMNRHRRTLSQIKGGKLATHFNCTVLQFLISDVPGDHLEDIGSGLLVPDDSTGMSADLPIWQNIDTHIIASSAIAQAAVALAASERGLIVRQASGSLHGDMDDVIGRLTAVLQQNNVLPGVYIWGGEPTVVLPEKPGRGGRNQHLALAMVPALATRIGASLLVCGTDGSDGPTSDAGGLVSCNTAEKAFSRQLDVEDYLHRADAGNCLAALDALVTTGPTGTNVMDLAIAYLE